MFCFKKYSKLENEYIKNIMNKREEIRRKDIMDENYKEMLIKQAIFLTNKQYTKEIIKEIENDLLYSNNIVLEKIFLLKIVYLTGITTTVGIKKDKKISHEYKFTFESNIIYNALEVNLPLSYDELILYFKSKGLKVKNRKSKIYIKI